jgi:hypothetical protein
LFIDLPPLRTRYSEHAERGVSIHGESYCAGPDLLFDFRINGFLG